jgi:cellobiose transport system substrate-binding protein
MGVTPRWRMAAALAAVALAATGCGDGSGEGSSSQNVTLTVDVFGTFGYDELYKQFEASHPGVTVKERGTGANLSDYTPKLTQYLAAGAGAGDVIAIEEGTLIQFQAQADKFENLLEYGAADKKENFLPWKWELGLTSDGKKLLGLGTDVGGLAMCYRTDLFTKAGLPATPDEVSKLWPTWDAFMETGNRFKAANTGASFVDAATNVFEAILKQNAGTSGGFTYYDKSNKLVVDSNHAVRDAWDTTNKMISAGLSGNFQSWSDQWVAAFKQSKFATIACPAWMTGVIEGNAGAENSGKWNIAAIPGGGGNWGGSWMAVPKQGKHKKLAAELAQFLTSPEGQIAAWKAKGNLPSSPKALDDASVKDAKNAYFSGAPTGVIFAKGAKELKPVYFGPKNQAVSDAILNAIRSVEQKQRTADQAWTEAVNNAKKAAA